MAMMLDRRAFLVRAAAGGITLLPPSPVRSKFDAIFQPEDFGARGDGATNDTDAFAALCAHINQQGGGTISLARGRTYIVGKQVRHTERYFLTGQPIMLFERLTKPLRILGNGARLAAEFGLMFGVFDQETLSPLNSALPNYRPTGISTPYDAMISVSGCRSLIEIQDIELDGRLGQMRIGGPWGDTGRQLPGSGLILTDNHSTELIRNVYSHHHPLDGVIINGSENRSGRGRFARLIARYNGRQGVSLVGGKSYDFADCEFSYTGRSAVFSAPGAGVDIEAEGKRNRDINFVRCDFIDNSGVGLLAAEGDSEGITCTNCRLVGTTSWSAWPNKPRMRFMRCMFVGAVVHPFASANAALATVFQNCKFTDDPALAPRGKVYFNDPSGSGPTVDLGGNGGVNVLFHICSFDLTHKGRLPWSLGAIYADNVMYQKAPETGYPRGRYIGRNVISGNVDLYSSTIEGELIVNGNRVVR